MVVKKNTPSKDLSFSNSKIKEALDFSADTFKERSSSYDEISEDYKSAETFLRNTGLKELFSYDFNRLRGGVNPPEFWYTTWDRNNYHNYHKLEALEWRFEGKSSKFRLMVSKYLLRRDKKETTKWEDLHGEEASRFYFIEESRPIIEAPIETRIFYHSRLPKFITTFAEVLKELKQNVDGYYPVIFDHADESHHYHLSDSIKLKKGKETIELFGGNDYQTKPKVLKMHTKEDDIPF